MRCSHDDTLLIIGLDYEPPSAIDAHNGSQPGCWIIGRSITGLRHGLFKVGVRPGPVSPHWVGQLCQWAKVKHYAPALIGTTTTRSLNRKP
jgi:hypothetical protein